MRNYDSPLRVVESVAIGKVELAFSLAFAISGVNGPPWANGSRCWIPRIAIFINTFVRPSFFEKMTTGIATAKA
jgi:hypothetical protein